MGDAGADSDVEVQYEETEEGYRWTLSVRGRGTVVRSDETFPHEYAAEDAVEPVRAAAADAAVRTFDEPTLLAHRYEVEKNSILPFVGPRTVVRDGEDRLLDADGTELTGGGRTFESREAADAALERTMERAEEAVQVEADGAAFELFEDDDGHGWRLVAAAGDVLVRGEDRYDDEREVRNLVDAVRRWAASSAP